MQVRSLEMQVQYLEEGMATHSSSLAGRIPWTEEPGGLQSQEWNSGLPYCRQISILQSVAALQSSFVFYDIDNFEECRPIIFQSIHLGLRRLSMTEATKHAHSLFTYLF